MSRGGDIELAFAGETRRFRLAIGGLKKVQEKCDAGPGELLQRLAPFVLYSEARRVAQARGAPELGLLAAAQAGHLGAWRVDDIREPILQGLIGGGLDGPSATQVVLDWVDDRPLLESIPTAFFVLMAAIAGAEDENPTGEPAGETGQPSPSPEASSASASTATTPPAPPPASPRRKSTP